MTLLPLSKHFVFDNLYDDNSTSTDIVRDIRHIPMYRELKTAKDFDISSLFLLEPNPELIEKGFETLRNGRVPFDNMLLHTTYLITEEDRRRWDHVDRYSNFESAVHVMKTHYDRDTSCYFYEFRFFTESPEFKEVDLPMRTALATTVFKLKVSPTTVLLNKVPIGDILDKYYMQNDDFNQAVFAIWYITQKKTIVNDIEFLPFVSNRESVLNPGDEEHFVVVRDKVIDRKYKLVNKRRTPKGHDVRGHQRHYKKTSETIWVGPHHRGDDNLGKVTTHYTVEA